ncbi:MAG: hypothetical protein ACTSRK_17085, partial [Promethearchaeota archaeon]
NPKLLEDIVFSRFIQKYQELYENDFLLRYPHLSLDNLKEEGTKKNESIKHAINLRLRDEQRNKEKIPS